MPQPPLPKHQHRQQDSSSHLLAPSRTSELLVAQLHQQQHQQATLLLQDRLKRSFADAGMDWNSLAPTTQHQHHHPTTMMNAVGHSAAAGGGSLRTYANAFPQMPNVQMPNVQPTNGGEHGGEGPLHPKRARFW